MPETHAHAEVHHPATVGSTFMRQYYHLLAKEPASLHRFYKDESTWCHGVGSHMQDAIAGQKAINDEILRRGYAGARVDLDIGSIDCQPSLHGGVFVLVTGVMTLASSVVPKPFVQTFFLAVQPNGYFVLNDCLRFLELPGASAASDVAVAPTDAKKQPAQAAIGTPVVVVASSSPAAAPKSKPVTPLVKKDKAPPASPVAKPVESPVSPIKIKSPAQPKKVASPKATPVVAAATAASPKAAAAPASPVKKAAPADAAKTTPKPSETKPATPASPAVAAAAATAAAATVAMPASPPAPTKPAEPAAPPTPKTWAALFSGSPAAPAKPTPVAAPKPAPVAASATKPASPAPADTDAVAKTTDAAVGAASTAVVPSHDKEKRRLYSLFIRDVPSQTKEGDLRELFKPYGAIASVGMPPSRGIAFIDYREEESMRAALADDKEFKLFDKVLHVEERKDNKERPGFRADGGRGGRGGGAGGGGRGPPRSGRGGERDGRERRDANGKAPSAATNNGDRRDKGGRRSGKEDGGRGGRAE